MRLLGMCLMAMLALGADTAGAVAPKSRLELKEEGVPVPVGAEVTEELKATLAPGCRWLEPLPMTKNPATKDKLIAPPDPRGPGGREERGELSCASPSETSLFSDAFSVITMTAGGTARVVGEVLVAFGQNREGVPCEYAFRKVLGSFPVPGSAVISGSAVAHVFRAGREPGCANSESSQFTITLIGRNNKPLETAIG